MHASTKIIELQKLLAEKYPQLPKAAASTVSTGAERWDAALRGGLRNGAVTEVIAAQPSAGTALLLGALFAQSAAAGRWVALIDARDAFDAEWLGEGHDFSRFLWVRCPDAALAVKAADLLLRDGNIGVVVLDLRLNPRAQLRKIQPQVWYRLQRLVEESAAVLLAATPFRTVSSAKVQLILHGRWTLDALETPQSALLPEAEFSVEGLAAAEHCELKAG